MFRICRLCMKQNDNVHCIFNRFFTDGERVCDKIMYCTGLEMSENDGLPSLICEDCQGELIIAYKFKDNCIQTDKNLRDSLLRDVDTIDFESIDSDQFGPYDLNDLNTDAYGCEFSDTETGLNYQYANTGGPIVENCYSSELNTNVYQETQNNNINYINNTLNTVDINTNNSIININNNNGINNNNINYINEYNLDNVYYPNYYQVTTTNPIPANEPNTTPINKPSIFKKDHKCEICNIEFTSRQAAYSHRRRKHKMPSNRIEKKDYKCQECNLKFSNRQKAFRHKQKHLQNLPLDNEKYNCEYCNNEFENRRNYLYHMKCNHSEANGTPKCVQCDIVFTNIYQLYKHKKDKHDATRKKRVQDGRKNRPLKQHVCIECNILFKDRFEAASHRNKIHRAKRICEICGAVCGTQYKQHILNHFPPKFWCDHCEYKTANKSDLRKHLRIHYENTKTHSCEQCTYKTRFSSNLNQHIKACHDKIKSYQCHLCQYKCNEKRLMNEHIDSHSSIKRHHCHICGTSMASAYNFKKHLQKQHGVQPQRMKPGRKSVAFKCYWAKRGWDKTDKVYPSAGYPETSSVVLGSRVTALVMLDRLFTINLPDGKQNYKNLLLTDS